MRIDVLTLFPELFRGFAETALIRIAREKGLLDVRFRDIRDHTRDKHRTVDDRPFGGGPGMVLKPGPVVSAVEATVAAGRFEDEAAAGMPAAPNSPEVKSPTPLMEPTPCIILLSPQGRRLDQPLLGELARERWLVVVCGHYEGFDERIIETLDPLELSIGDYVVSGGEVAAPVLIDGVVRLIPGVLGDPRSAEEESFTGDDLLDYPNYTRPREFRGLEVPEVLLSGDHRRVAAWRAEQARLRTRERRGDPADGAEADSKS